MFIVYVPGTRSVWRWTVQGGLCNLDVLIGN